MENYVKGKNVEEELEKNNLPIPDLPENFLWMHVKGGSKINNLVSHAIEKFPKEFQSVLWSGSGAATGKTISCAEILKRNMPNVHQISRICYRRIEEYWEPKLEGLDQIVVTRNIPTIHIYQSINQLNQDEPGYQAPGKKLTNVSKRQKQTANQQQKQSQEHAQTIPSSSVQTKYSANSKDAKRKRSKKSHDLLNQKSKLINETNK